MKTIIFAIISSVGTCKCKVLNAEPQKGASTLCSSLKISSRTLPELVPKLVAALVITQHELLTYLFSAEREWLMHELAQLAGTEVET